MDFTIKADHSLKIKQKDRQILGSCKRAGKLWNMKVAVIPIVVGALGTVLKGLEKKLEGMEIRERIKTIQTAVVF